MQEISFIQYVASKITLVCCVHQSETWAGKEIESEKWRFGNIKRGDGVNSFQQAVKGNMQHINLIKQ